MGNTPPKPKKKTSCDKRVSDLESKLDDLRKTNEYNYSKYSNNNINYAKKLEDLKNNYLKCRDDYWKAYIKYNQSLQTSNVNWYKEKCTQYIDNFSNFYYYGLVNQIKNTDQCKNEIISSQNLILSLLDNIINIYKNKLNDLKKLNNEKYADIDTLNRDIAYDIKDISKIEKTEYALAYVTLAITGCVVFLTIFRLMFITGKQNKLFSFVTALCAAILVSLIIKKLVILIVPSISNINFSVTYN